MIVVSSIACWASGGVGADVVVEQVGADIDGRSPGDRFGTAVALSADGDRVAIGAPHDGLADGVVRVYDTDGETWLQAGADIEDPGGGDIRRFAIAVALSADGSRLAVGDPGSSTVRVYDWDGSGWGQVGSDVVDGTDAGFAVSLSADGNRLAIGDPAEFIRDPGGGGDLGFGTVRVYDWVGGAWVRAGLDIDSNCGVRCAMDEHGYAVVLSADGERLAISAPGHSTPAISVGTVRIYDWDGDGWTQAGGDIDGIAESESSGLGLALSADGDRVAIGAPFNSDAGERVGTVRVYDWVGGAWTQAGDDIDGIAESESSGLGLALSADGDRIAIGAPDNSATGDRTGVVRLFDWDGVAWVRVGGDITGANERESAGRSVTLAGDGGRLAIGAPGANGVDELIGSVRVYDLVTASSPPTLDSTTTSTSPAPSSTSSATTAARPAPPTLPRTGSPGGGWLIATLAVSGGGLLMFAARRRTPHTQHGPSAARAD